MMVFLAVGLGWGPGRIPPCRRGHGKGRHVEGEMIVRHQHMRGKGSADIEFHFHMRTDRPVLGGNEMQGCGRRSRSMCL